MESVEPLVKPTILQFAMHHAWPNTLAVVS